MLLGQVAGQTSADSLLAVDVNFKFPDGLYANATDLINYKPISRFTGLGGKLVLQEAEYTLKVEMLHPAGRPDLPIPMEGIGVICLNGLPYFRAFYDADRKFTVYAGLRVRGRLSYYTYDELQYETVMIKAYNPATGKPFRQQELVRSHPKLVEKVVDLTTGEHYDFTLDNMLQLLASDPALVKSLQGLSVDEATARLQRCLLIFDDRHPLYLPKPD